MVLEYIAKHEPLATKNAVLPSASQGDRLAHTCKLAVSRFAISQRVKGNSAISARSKLLE